MTDIEKSQQAFIDECEELAPLSLKEAAALFALGVGALLAYLGVIALAGYVVGVMK